MKAQKKPVRRRAARRTVLTLAQRVERLERLQAKQVIADATAAFGYADAPRFTKLVEAGETTHVAVRDARTGLIWSAAPLAGGDRNWKDAAKACADCRLLGHSDWRLPTITELLSIVDYDRHEPAVDPEFFKGPYGYTWSSTPAKWNPAGFAWGVYLVSGYSNLTHQASDFRVRAVRAGQLSAVGVN